MNTINREEGPPTFDQLREVEPPDWPGRSLVEQDNMGDWGMWLARYDGPLQDTLTDPADDCAHLAEMMADDYITECDEQGFAFPADFANEDERSAAERETRAAIVGEFVAFLRAWREAWERRNA